MDPGWVLPVVGGTILTGLLICILIQVLCPSPRRRHKSKWTRFNNPTTGSQAVRYHHRDRVIGGTDNPNVIRTVHDNGNSLREVDLGLRPSPGYSSEGPTAYPTSYIEPSRFSQVQNSIPQPMSYPQTLANYSLTYALDEPPTFDEPTTNYSQIGKPLTPGYIPTPPYAFECDLKEIADQFS